MPISITMVIRAIRAIKTKIATIVIMRATATTATVASRNYWLYKISEVSAFTSQRLKIMHLYLKIERFTGWRTS